MTTTRSILLSSLLGGMLLATGCKSLAGCMKPPAEADTREHPPLKVPVGLDAPDNRDSMKIPVLDAPAVPAPLSARCLEDPPLIAPLPDPVGDEKAAKKAARKATNKSSASPPASKSGPRR